MKRIKSTDRLETGRSEDNKPRGEDPTTRALPAAAEGPGLAAACHLGRAISIGSSEGSGEAQPGCVVHYRIDPEECAEGGTTAGALSDGRDLPVGLAASLAVGRSRVPTGAYGHKRRQRR